MRRAVAFLSLALVLASCRPLTIEEQQTLGIPDHLQVDPNATTPTVRKGPRTDPTIINALVEVLEKSDRISPDISNVEDTPFEEILTVGSPVAFGLRNRYLHPGVPLAEALAEDPDPDLRSKLVEMARWERSSEVRTTALVGLARMQDDRDMMIFREAVANLDPAIRFGAMEALIAWNKPDQSVPILKSAAEHDAQPALRVYAAAGMAQLGDDEGVEKLRKFLNDPDWVVRSMAARYLGDFGEGKDYHELVRRLGQEQGNDFVLAEFAIAALKLFPKAKD